MRIAIVGGGFGGYNAALKLAKGNKVTLIENETLGGTCLNRGCIPSKLFLHYSFKKEPLARIQEISDKTIRQLVEGIKFLIDNKKISYISDEAKITGKNSILLKKSGKTIEFDKLILATGSEPIVPEKFRNAPGAVTSDEIIRLETIPRKLTIIGGGYIGVEFAHILTSLGTQVTIIEKEKNILPAIDTEASDILAKEMAAGGVRILTGTSVEKIEGRKAFITGGEGIPYDNILLCLGRRARTIETNVPLELENGHFKTNDFFQTSQPDIFAIGDCTSGPMLAHKAAYDAEVLATNLSGKKEKRDYSRIPYCVFSRPNLAGIGLMENLETVKMSFTAIGKAHCDESTQGFLKIAVDEKKKIIGAVVINKHAAEIISALTVIVQNGLSCHDVAKMTFTHPTSSEIIKEIAKKALKDF